MRGLMVSAVAAAVLAIAAFGVNAVPVISLVTLMKTSSGMCTWSYTYVYYSRSYILGDVDGDGVKDIVIGNRCVGDCG